MDRLPPHQIIGSGQHWWSNRCDLTPLPAYAHHSLNRDQVGQCFGQWEIIAPDRLYGARWGHALAPAMCHGCDSLVWVSLGNVTTGKSTQCNSCSACSDVPRWLVKRCSAQQQRCENPRNPGYADYGGRGITFEFDSPTAAAEWVMWELGLERDKELDRIDNDRGYAPGNLRWVSRSQNTRNTRASKLPEDWEYLEGDWPYARHTVERLLRAGLSREDILARARQAVVDRRKGWQRISARLESLTF